MYNFTHDAETGGLLLTTDFSVFSKEPRPVFSSELDLFGFNEYWTYDKNDDVPYMWAESANYVYRGKRVAKLVGGSLYTPPEIVLTPEGEELTHLEPIDVEEMVRKNKEVLDSLVNDTIKRVYSVYSEYRNKVDLFYVAFSGGKDSVVALDIVQRSIPHDEFVVLFGDTRMESPDTYISVSNEQKFCKEQNIRFYVTDKTPSPEETWVKFGPPGNTNRWCCTVHKTVPQILKLREITGKEDFLGFAFTGVRGDESAARADYDFLNLGEKHKGQYSYHTILNWSSAELFLYMFSEGIDIPIAYKKGNSRVGCLMCPMSPSKHDFVKNTLYPDEMGTLVKLIQKTYHFENKDDSFEKQQIEAGYWKSRRSGATLDLGLDKHQIVQSKDRTVINIYQHLSDDWKTWCKTFGSLVEDKNGTYSVFFKNKVYYFNVDQSEDSAVVEFKHPENTKDQIEFASYLKTIFIKTLYCVNCGACVVNCRNGQLHMEDGKLTIGSDCLHCLKCHDNHSRCICYNSKRNTLYEGKSMKGLDRYATFGFRKTWVESYFNLLDDFWEEDENLGTKMLDAFCKFLEDSGLSVVKKGSEFNKWSRHRASPLAIKLSSMGADSLTVWGIITVNLCYSPQLNWYVSNVVPGEFYTVDRLTSMLELVMEGDPKGKGKRNVVSSIKNIMIQTPIGADLGLGVCDYEEKSNGITLNCVQRDSWINPDETVLLYAMYKLAEGSDQHQFSLSDLCNISLNPLSPACIFNIPAESIKTMFSGLSNKYPDFISASFTHDLEVVTLNKERTSADVLDLLG